MAGNNIQYTIGFNANTSQAKSELAQLQNTLKQISNMSLDLVDSGDIQDIQSAATAARELSSALDAATNKNTGKLDLSMFQKSISKSGNDLNDLISRLSLAGNTGSKAFQQLAKSVTNAHMPIKQTSKLMNDFANTMKNTIKWQLSSNIVHGLQSGLEGAISYAKNLNSSLNDIRIVTGASADEMARFSESANKAAKRLSATTLDYTKASLIYYQQGDDDATVKKKADLTLKAANASPGTSTEEMSEYLTAVWNSYKVGADELERYVDIMAALGAKTATSLEEIATSMQKVAATGNTVGVSMEQVSSIIATVSSVTRESAQSIGTSFKTIFARMGDLKLGKEDEDGIVLGQVSEGLEKIGVDILTANGDLRDMGDVITELGNKWQTMSNAEKAATAQLVAGKRQYTQLMALFENWDMYQENMDISMDSDGALQEMQDIYAESWAAASKRVKASLESVYSDVINDEAIIKITNGIADLIDKVHSLVDAFGGVESAIGIVGSVFLKTMKPQIKEGIDGFINNMDIWSGKAQQDFVNNQQKIMKEMVDNASISDADQKILGYYNKLQEKQSELLLSGKKYSQEEIAQIEATIDKIKNKIEYEAQLIEISNQKKENTKMATTDLANEFVQSVAEDMLSDDQNWDDLKFSEQQEYLDAAKSAKEGSDLYFINDKNESIAALKESLGNIEDMQIKVEIDTDDGQKSLSSLGDKGVESAQDIISAFALAEKTIAKATIAEKSIQEVRKKASKNDTKKEDGTPNKINMPEQTKEAAKDFINTIDKLGLDESLRQKLVDDVETALNEADSNAQDKIDNLRKILDNALDMAETKVAQINTAAGEISKNAQGAMKGNVSDKKVKQVQQTAQAEGRDEMQNPAMSPDDMNKQIEADFQAATESSSAFADSLANVTDGLVTTASGVMTLKGGIEGLIKGNSSLLESFIAIGSGIAMTLNGASNLTKNFGALGEAYKKGNDAIIKYAASTRAAKAASQGHAVAKGAETAAIKGADTAMKGFMASNPLGWILAIVAAVVALASAIGGVISKIKEANAAASEDAEEQMSKIAAKRREAAEETALINETMGRYKELQEQYKTNKNVEEEYANATSAVLDALGLEALQVEITKGKYQELAEVIEYANNKRRNQELFNAEVAEKDLKTYNNTYWSGIDDRKDWAGKDYFGNTIVESDGSYTLRQAGNRFTSDLVGQNRLWKTEAEMWEQLKAFGLERIGGFDGSRSINFSSDTTQITKTYSAMKEFLDSSSGKIAATSDAFMVFFEMIETMANPIIENKKLQGNYQAQALLNDEYSSIDTWGNDKQWESEQDRKNAFFEAADQSVANLLENLGLPEEEARSVKESILQSWAESLSAGDDFEEYKAEIAKKELYGDSVFAEQYNKERQAENKMYDEQKRNEDLHTLYRLGLAEPSAELTDMIEYMNEEYGYDIVTNMKKFGNKDEKGLQWIGKEVQRSDNDLGILRGELQTQQEANSEYAQNYLNWMTKNLGLGNDTQLKQLATSQGLNENTYMVSEEERGTLVGQQKQLDAVVAQANQVLKFDELQEEINLGDNVNNRFTKLGEGTADEQAIGRAGAYSLNMDQAGQIVQYIKQGKGWDESLAISEAAFKEWQSIYQPEFDIKQAKKSLAFMALGPELEGKSNQEVDELVNQWIQEHDKELISQLGRGDNATATNKETIEYYAEVERTIMSDLQDNLPNLLATADVEGALQEGEFQTRGQEVVDIEKMVQAYDILSGLKDKEDLKALTGEEFTAFRESLGSLYKNMSREEMLDLDEDAFNQMLRSSATRFDFIINDMYDQGRLSADQIATVMDASVKMAETANKAATEAWENVISQSREEADEQWENEQKMAANNRAIEGIQGGLAYEELDAVTRNFLEIQAGGRAQAEAKYTSGSISSYQQENRAIANEVLPQMEEQFNAMTTIIQGAVLNEDQSAYNVGYDSILDAFGGDVSEALGFIQNFSENYGTAITDQDGFVTSVEMSPEMMQQYRNAWMNQAQEMASISEVAAPNVLNEQETYDYLQGLDSQFSALDAFENDVTTENLLALRDALDMSNESIRQYYEAVASAGSEEEREMAIDDLTRAILQQSDAELTSSESSDLLLQKYQESYGIMDIYGKALTTNGIKLLPKLSREQLRVRKSFTQLNKAVKDGTKTVKMGNREYEDMVDLYKDVAKAVKNGQGSIEDITDSIEGLNDSEKDLIKNAGRDYLDTMQQLETAIPNAFGGMTEGMQAAVNEMDLDGLINQMLTPEAFNGLMSNIVSADMSVTDAINQMAQHSDSAIQAMGAQLQASASANGQIDLGTVLQGMGVDVSNPIAVLEALRNFLQRLASTPYFTGAGDALGPVNSALSAAQSLQGQYGGGGGGVQNANKPSSGGGGGGGGGNKEKKEYKRFKDEVERYHVQNETLSRIGEQLDSIEKLKDRTYGSDHVAQLDAETEALRRQYDAQVDLYDEAMKWRAADQAELVSLGVGVQFDENGTISNYEDVIQGLIDQYNAAVDVYNESEQEEGDKLRLEDAEQFYEDAKTAIENYEEAVATANEAQNEMADILNQISEIELEKITYELELDIQVNEADLEMLEYYRSKYEDSLYAQDELFDSLMQSAAEYESNITEIGKAIADLEAGYANGTGPIMEAQYAEGMADLSSQLIDNLSSLQNIATEISETYTNALELARDEIDKTMSTLDSFNSAMESYIEIAGLQGRDFFVIDGQKITNSFKGLESLYEAQYDNNLKRVLVQKEYLDVLVEEEAYFKARISSGEELTDLEKKQYASLREQIQDTQDGLLSATQETLDGLKAAYENTINGIAQDLDSFMSGSATSLEHLADQYAYFQEEQGRYVSTAKELFEVSKLTRDIENSIAEASTNASKEALKALQEKINKQSELNELTEYDIQMNQLQYQLLLARIQLEEAQNAKDTVRLTRDDNGNYAYQYTADQNKVDEAVSQYEDVLQQINDLTAQRTTEIEQQMIDAMQNYKEQFQTIALDETLTAEERNMKLEELYARFSQTMGYLQEQNGIVTENLTANQEAIAEHYGVNMSEIMASTAGNVNESIQSMMENTEMYIEAMRNAIYGEEGAQSAWSEFAEKMGIVSALSGTSYENMLGSAEEMGEMSDYATEEAIKTLETLQDTLEPVNDLTTAWNEHNETLQETINYYEQLANSINKTLSAISESDAIGGVNIAKAQGQSESVARPIEELIAESITQNAEAMSETVSQTSLHVNTGEIYDSILSYLGDMTRMQMSFKEHSQSVADQTPGEWIQEITIHADFPNANLADEIVQAFETLSNDMAQLASRKN